MPTRKGQTKDNRYNPKANGKGQEEYEVNYYGDETFLKIDVFENEKNIIEAKIGGLKWRNKVLVISVIVLSIFALGNFTLSIIHQLKMDFGSTEFEDELHTIHNVEENLGQRLGRLENGLGDLEKRKTSNITLKGGDLWSYGNVYINGGPVCDDHWTSNEAMVVCKSLGFRLVWIYRCL